VDSTTLTTPTFDNVSTINGQDFLLTVSPPAVISGGGIQYTVNVGALGGFSGSVALTATGLPTGGTANFSQPSLTSGTSVLTITPAPGTAANLYPITITGTSGILVHSVAVNLIVTSTISSLWTDLDVGVVGPAGGTAFNGTTFSISSAGGAFTPYC
jgi:hypothetical protein